MDQVILLKCGEVVLKGLNRRRFEDRLLKDIKEKIKPHGDFTVRYSQSTYTVTPMEGADIEGAFGACLRVFGIVSVAKAAVCEQTMEAIAATARECVRLPRGSTFKAEARRAEKNFPHTSPEISAMVGGVILESNPGVKVKMEDPDHVIRVEIRDNAAYVNYARERGAGGMPLGTAGRAMLMISGGIDSPVAGYMMAKRGTELFCIHFASPPYTSQEALDKVRSLAGVLAAYVGRVRMLEVPFTHIQQEMAKAVKEDYFTLVMRRMMMRITCRAARRYGCAAVITGESLAQVASQTMEALAVTDSLADMPVFRPLIGMDKEDIITVSRKMGAFEISSLPYEDCCTVFTPRHPQTKPKLCNVVAEEEKLDVEALVEEALAGAVLVAVGRDGRVHMEEK